jgi:Pentapeptide repeats (8 copies)
LRLTLEVIAGLVALGGFLWLWWKGVPTLYQGSGAGSDARVQAVTGTRTALLVGLAGVGAVGALWLNNRTYRLTQQGQITDRYTKAIEQLGAEKLAVRLGGIYVLERIAVDSKRDHSTVVEVLSAFVRECAEKQTVVEVPSEFFREIERSKIDQPALSGSKARLATDIQAVLTVLGRLPHRQGVSRGDLEGALLIGAQLWRANLSDAWLQEANLSRAQLEGANLSSAQLRQADLSDAQFYEADLSGARFWDANLSRAQIEGADLSGAHGLTQEQLDTATGDAMTQLPDGVRRPSAWAAGEEQTAGSGDGRDLPHGP